jgi:glycine/D-amino acid oxidase-like deaminating enzyme/nitrite reductase/ring-hydroxylating ferredoxin subunit
MSSIDLQAPIAEHGSPWHAGNAGQPRRAPLARDLDVDVVVIGAGMVGLATAWELHRAGASVAVLEARRVAAATSGNTTAKLSSLQGTAYSDLVRAGTEAAEQFARANEAGIEWIASLVAGLEVECGWKRTSNYTFADHPSEVDQLEREAQASQAAGLGTELVEDLPLPFPVAGAVRLDDQAQFDPVAFLTRIAAELDADEQVVYEDTRACQIARGTVTTAAGSHVKADRIVVATHLPVVDRVGLFARVEPMASFGITAELTEPTMDGMFIDVAGQHSFRTVEIAGDPCALVVGQGHRLGTGDPIRSLTALETYGHERLGAGRVDYRFDAHDFITEDRLPLVGPVSTRSEAMLTATGMNKWGLALGAECGRMLADTIVSGSRSWPSEFDSQRLPRPRSWPTLAANGAKTGWHLVADRLQRRSAAKDIPPGGGAVIGAGLGQQAVHRDDAGRLHRLSARCTHLGCIVAWNQAAKTWDCPCHGSRFAVDGAVLEGPAKSGLEPKSAETEPSAD